MEATEEGVSVTGEAEEKGHDKTGSAERQQHPTKVELPTVHPDLLLGVDRGLNFDIGNLTAFSYQPIDPAVVKEKGLKQFLEDEGRDCTQLLLNQILRVPTTRTPEGDVLGQLPRPTTVLPREKHMPTPRPPTRWEKFANIKGIKKKKKSKLAWDETEQSWKRRHGYDKANDEQKQWLVEVKSSDANPHEDPWARLEGEKKERVTKQRKREERNRAEGQSVLDKQAKKQGIPTKPPSRPSPKELGQTIDVVNKSTASLGKFHEKLAEEPKHTKLKGKRKFDPVAPPSTSPATKKAKKVKRPAGGEGGEGQPAEVAYEKKQNLAIFENLMKKQEEGDPSFVPDKKVLELQKRKLGKRDRKSAY